MDDYAFADLLNADFESSSALEDTSDQWDVLSPDTPTRGFIPQATIPTRTTNPFDHVDTQPNRPAIVRQSTNQWDPRLILDLAIGVEGVEDILPRYGISDAEFAVLSDTPTFRRELAMAMRDARENGLPFSQKARFQAESYLEVLDDLVYSELTPANVRLEAIRSTVLWGKLVPKEVKGDDGNTGATINVQINF